MDTVKKCMISRYDETITGAPFFAMQIDSVEVLQPGEDHLGEKFAERLRDSCWEKGYNFKFYSLSTDENYDYSIVVW
jgi:hypothetical protein